MHTADFRTTATGAASYSAANGTQSVPAPMAAPNGSAKSAADSLPLAAPVRTTVDAVPAGSIDVRRLKGEIPPTAQIMGKPGTSDQTHINWPEALGGIATLGAGTVLVGAPEPTTVTKWLGVPLVIAGTVMIDHSHVLSLFDKLDSMF